MINKSLQMADHVKPFFGTKNIKRPEKLSEIELQSVYWRNSMENEQRHVLYPWNFLGWTVNCTCLNFPLISVAGMKHCIIPDYDYWGTDYHRKWNSINQWSHYFWFCSTGLKDSRKQDFARRMTELDESIADAGNRTGLFRLFESNRLLNNSKDRIQ